MVKELAVIKSLGGASPKVYEARIITGNYFQNAITTHAEPLDGHFLLYGRVHTQREPLEQHVFGVVNSRSPDLADERLYRKALEFVQNCEIDDRTSHAKQNSA